MFMDSEGAFVSKEMKEYFESVDIKYFFTLGHAPVAERQIRTVKDLYTGVSKIMGVIGLILYFKSYKPTITKWSTP